MLPDKYQTAPDNYHLPPDKYFSPPDNYPDPPDKYFSPPDMYPDPPDKYLDPPDNYPDPPDMYLSARNADWRAVLRSNKKFNFKPGSQDHTSDPGFIIKWRPATI